MYAMSTHFRERWAERVGKPLPSPGEMAKLLERAVVIQYHQELYTARGERRPAPTLYWHPDKRLIFKVDARRNMLISVLTPACLEERRRQT